MLSKNKAKYVRSLHLKKNRESEGLFIAEGKKIVSEILAAKGPVTELYATHEFLEANEQHLEGEFEIVPISHTELKTISGLKEPDDALAVCSIKENEIDYSKFGKQLILYLDSIRDPGNFGTIIRVCDWFGITQVICSMDSVDLYNPKTIQATMGSFLRVNIIYQELEIITQHLSEHKIQLPVYGAYMEGENIFEMKQFAPGILVIGNEARGISESVEKLIDRKISIPRISSNGPESLNAGIATSIILAEFTRLNR
jgi:RNA methyltransferase, TrmH family